MIRMRSNECFNHLIGLDATHYLHGLICGATGTEFTRRSYFGRNARTSSQEWKQEASIKFEKSQFHRLLKAIRPYRHNELRVANELFNFMESRRSHVELNAGRSFMRVHAQR